MGCFAVQINDIEGRIDPLFYAQDILQKFKKTKFEFVELGSVVEYFKSGFPAGKSQQADEVTEFIQIRPTNIDKNNNLVFRKNIYLTDKLARLKKNEKIIRGDVLFNNTNSQELVGKTTFFDVEGTFFCSNHITRIGVITKKLKPKYLVEILNLYQTNKVFFNLCTNWNNQSGINNGLLKNIKIPLPPLEVQNKIIELMDEEYKNQKLKEQKAKRYLDSINNFVLEQLDIKIPEINSRLTFSIRLNSIKERLDPYYNLPFFVKLDEELTRISAEPFNEIIKVITKGETPLWRGDKYEETGIPFLKVQNISQRGIKKDLAYISKDVHKRMKRSQLFGGELLYTMAGSIGIATIYPQDMGEANINQAIAKIILNNDINKDYVVAVLNSSICVHQSERNLTKSAQPNINFEQIKSLRIPIPSPEIQTKIVNELTKRQDKIEQLKQEALDGLNSAKQKVEEIIIG